MRAWWVTDSGVSGAASPLEAEGELRRPGNGGQRRGPVAQTEAPEDFPGQPDVGDERRHAHSPAAVLALENVSLNAHARNAKLGSWRSLPRIRGG